MFPMEFDRNVLDGLPFPDPESIGRVIKILRSMVTRRVLPYFKTRRGTDPLQLAKISKTFSIERLEDYSQEIEVIGLVDLKSSGPVLCIHERFFDLLAFVIPSDPHARLGEGPLEEQRILAFAEFLLRHLMEHALYPEHMECDVVEADAEFAKDRSANDPTFYRNLTEALDDELNGLKGAAYSALLDAARAGHAIDKPSKKIVASILPILSRLPIRWLAPVLPWLAPDLQTRIFGECYKRSRTTIYSLLERAGDLRKLMQLFDSLIQHDDSRAKEVFRRFVERWGLVALFHELGLESETLDSTDTEQLYEKFRDGLTLFLRQQAILPPPVGPMPAATASPAEFRRHDTATSSKSLKDRIEEARGNPQFPPQVLQIIDKNKLNAVGHSGSKYSELIETLLAIPWGRTETIEVSPAEFEQGLNHSHYGLQKPKEIISDFFINLIWRAQQQRSSDLALPQARTGSAFLFVGPPGVGKTSLAISIARNLGIPYHKLSLGGMKDEADLRGHGFTYEGSKPGAIVQGLIKMGVMNGMFIMDEADKTEKFAIATLLEILDPEQNHLFHDKFTQTSIDIDLSDCHFILTANTLETVPPPVINRCEVVPLDRYSIDEKVAIAREHLIERIRRHHQISEREISFEPQHEPDLLRYLVKTYTREAGVRELERVIRTLFLRLLRKEILGSGRESVIITRAKIKEFLAPPAPARHINPEDRIGEMLGLGVDLERGIGSVIPVQATRIRLAEDETPRQRAFMSMVHATGNIERVMDESRKVATTAILHCADELGIDKEHFDVPIHLHFMGGSSKKDGPSAGGAIALALASILSGTLLRRDLAMTGEIDTQGRITAVGGLDIKLETAYDAGCRTMIIPTENLLGEDGIERFSDALKEELQVLTYAQWQAAESAFDYRKQVLQVIAVDTIVEAAKVAFITQQEWDQAVTCLVPYARDVAGLLEKLPETRATDVTLVNVKDLCELDFPQDPAALGPAADLYCLATADTIRRIRDDPSRKSGCRELLEFDPSQRGIAGIADRLGSALGNDNLVPGRFTLVAPFYFIKEHFRPAAGQATGPFSETFLFANNFTAQGIKVKSCKATLNQAFLVLSRLNPRQLEACPFLSRLDGIYLMDLACIPEKLRLDQERAEKLINACIMQWLQALVPDSGAPRQTV